MSGDQALKREAGFALAFRFALRELRGGITGFRIFIACLTLGVAVIAAVGSVNKAIVDGVERESANILGADIRLGLFRREAPSALTNWAEERGAVLSRSTRLRTMARNEAGDEPLSALVELRGVDGLYPLYGAPDLSPVVDLQDALARDPATGRFGALIDPLVGTKLGLSVGDTLNLGSIIVDIRAELIKAPDQTGLGFQLGPTVMVSDEAMAQSALAGVGSLVNYYYSMRYGVPDLDIQAELEALDEAFPDENWQRRTRLRAAPGLERAVDQVGDFLIIVGLAALIVGGVGVGNAVKGYMDRKTKTIATLKIVGATGRVIAMTYFIQVFLIAFVSIIIGLIIGALSPTVASSFLPDAIPFSIDAAFYPDALLIAGAYGLLITTAFTAWPLGVARDLPAVRLFRAVVGTGSRRPSRFFVMLIVVSLIATFGLAVLLAESPMLATFSMLGAFFVLGLLRALAWLIQRLAARLPRPRAVVPRLALTNLHRPGSVTGAVVLSMGLGLTLFATLSLIRDNLNQSLSEGFRDDAPSFFMVDIQRAEADQLEKDILAIDGVSEFRAVPNLRGTIVRLNGDELTDERIQAIEPGGRWMVRGDRGMTYGRQFVEKDELVAGDWWPDDYSGQPEVSVGEDEARELGLTLGDSITINVLGVEIKAVIRSLRKIDFSSGQINFVFVFDPNTLKAAPHTFLATAKASRPSEPSVVKMLTKSYPGVTVISVTDAIEQVREVADQIAGAIDVTALVAIVSGVLVLAGAIAAGFRQRVYESVILKVVGAVRRQVLIAYAIEFAAVGLITALIALVLGGLAAWSVITFAWEGDFTLILEPMVVIVAIALLVTLGMGLLSSFSALSAKPNAVLRDE